MAQARIKISSTGKTLRSRNRKSINGFTPLLHEVPLEKSSLTVLKWGVTGFTMVEMLVVLFLIGLMLSIAVPSFIHTVETLKFKATARKIVSTLRYARNTAVFKQMSQAVGFDIDNNLYYLGGQKIDEDEDPLSRNIKTFKLPSDVSIKSMEMVKERIESGKGNILFYPDGSSSSGAIIVKNKRTDEGFIIEVDIFTGLTHVTFYRE